MEHLWSPWRMQYLQADDKGGLSVVGDPNCVFCQAYAYPPERDAEPLIVRRGEYAFIILNLYPYNNGHFMVVPYAHVPSLEELNAPALTEMMLLVTQGLAALRALYNPQAFNLGMNIGTAAGAGIAGHVHMHVVPRWAGDTNFMTVTAGTRVIPEDLRETWRRMREAWPTT